MQFLFPAFLYALGLVLIPVIIHLFNFRRYKRIAFSDVRFLKQVTDQNKKQQTLKHYLILLSRILLIAALVFAFAQPFLPPTNDKGGTRAEKRLSIYIDNSYSMEAAGKKGSLFEMAKDEARQLIEATGGETQIHILSNDFEGKHQRWLGKQEALEALNQLTISAASRNASEVLNRQMALFGGKPEGDAFWFSDFQQNLRLSEMPKPDSLFKVYAINLEANRNSNVWIDTAWFPDPMLRLGVSNQVRVRVRNGGTEDWENQPLVLKIDGVQKALQNLSVKAGGSETVNLSFALTDNLPHGFELSITDYPISFDDQYFLSGGAGKAMEVLVLNEGTPNPYIESVYKVDSLFQLRQQNINEASLISATATQAVILNEPKELSSGLQEQLNKYVKEGGVLVFIPSANPGGSISPWLLNFGLSLGKKSELNVNFDKPELGNPLFSRVFVKVPEMPSLPAARNYQPIGFGSGKPVLKMANGDVFLLEHNAGKGKLFVFGSTLKEENTGLVKHALFVPLMLNMPMQWKNALPASFLLGRETKWSLSGETEGKQIEIKKGDLTYRAEKMGNPESPYALIEGLLKEAGIYSLKLDGQAAGLLAFNFGRGESDFRFLADTEIEQVLEKAIKGNDFSVFSSQYAQGAKGTPIWHWFLWIALICILAEVALLRL